MELRECKNFIALLISPLQPFRPSFPLKKLTARQESAWAGERSYGSPATHGVGGFMPGSMRHFIARGESVVGQLSRVALIVKGWEIGQKRPKGQPGGRERERGTLLLCQARRTDSEQGKVRRAWKGERMLIRHRKWFSLMAFAVGYRSVCL